MLKITVMSHTNSLISIQYSRYSTIYRLNVSINQYLLEAVISLNAHFLAKKNCLKTSITVFTASFYNPS